MKVTFERDGQASRWRSLKHPRRQRRQCHWRRWPCHAIVHLRLLRPTDPVLYGGDEPNRHSGRYVPARGWLGTLVREKNAKTITSCGEISTDSFGLV